MGLRGEKCIKRNLELSRRRVWEPGADSGVDNRAGNIAGYDKYHQTMGQGRPLTNRRCLLNDETVDGQICENFSRRGSGRSVANYKFCFNTRNGLSRMIYYLKGAAEDRNNLGNEHSGDRIVRIVRDQNGHFKAVRGFLLG